MRAQVTLRAQNKRKPAKLCPAGKETTFLYYLLASSLSRMVSLIKFAITATITFPINYLANPKAGRLIIEEIIYVPPVGTWLFHYAGAPP